MSVDFDLERQPNVTDAMQIKAVEAYTMACQKLGIKNPALWGWPLACAIEAALAVRADGQTRSESEK